MDKVTNPFAPGAGTFPPELAGRENIIQDALVNIQRANIGNSCRSQMFLGLRGVGKTVILNKIETLAKENGHITTFIEADEKIDLIEVLYNEIQQVLKKLSAIESMKQNVLHGWAVLKSFLSTFEFSYGDIAIQVDPETGTADSGRLESDLSQLFLTIGELAKEAKKPWSLLIDEVQYIKPKDLAALIVALHKCNQKSVPILIFGAGLPLLAGISGEAKSYAERLFSYPAIGALSKPDAKNAIYMPISRLEESISDEALEAIYQHTKGYPYFLQEWGYEVWNHAKHGTEISSSDVDRATAATLHNLDEGFFNVRLERLTHSEKDFVIAMAKLKTKTYKVSDIAELLNKSTKSLSLTRSNIIKKGMIYSPTHGELAFTVPLFDEFLKRHFKL
ncbi:AAA family ATPase [[Haemophilus] felis]|nr:AAA family ATPase [[Haemophilus] felis]